MVDCQLHDNEGELRPIWVNTASDGLLKTALLNQAATVDIKIKFEQLIAGNAIDGVVNERVSFEDVERGDESAIWSLLLFSEYLKAVAVVPDYTLYRCQLAIPNEEVGMLYKDMFRHWLVEGSNRASYDRLLSNLIQGDVEAFTQGVYDFLLESSSSYDYGRQPEAFYQGFMLALTAGLTVTHVVESNPESGHGRPDIIYIPKDRRQGQDLAIILEFKQADVSLKQTVDKMATIALAQIKSNVYEAKLRQHSHIQQVLKVGLGFAKKSVCAAYVVEPIGQGLALAPNVTFTPVYGGKVDEKAVLQAVQQSVRAKRLASELLAEEAAEKEQAAVLMSEEDVAAAASTSRAASVTAAVKKGRVEETADAGSSSTASVAQTPASLFAGNVPLVQQESMAMDTNKQGQNPSP